MSEVSDSSAVGASQTFYDKNLIARASLNEVWTKWAQVRNLPANAGETIKFRRFSRLSAATTPLSEGVTPSGSALSKTDITAVPLQYGDYVTVSDYVNFTTLDPLLTEMSGILGDQAGETRDVLTRDVIVAGTTVQYASTATQRSEVSAAMKLNPAEVREALMTLQLNKGKMIMEMIDAGSNEGTTPIGKSYVGILGANTLFDLKSQAGFIPVQNYANKSNLMDGEVGAVDDCRFVRTDNPKVFTAAGASSADVHVTMILAKDAYGITSINGHAIENIIKPLGSGQDPLNQRATSGWKMTFIAKRLVEEWMVRIEHGVNG